jgi:hypothetical protein
MVSPDDVSTPVYIGDHHFIATARPDDHELVGVAVR